MFLEERHDPLAQLVEERMLHHVATTELPKVAPGDRSTVEWILMRHPNAGDDVFDLLLAAHPHENMRIEIELRRTPR